MDEKVFKRGAMLGLLFVALFFLGALVVYGVLTVSSITNWNMAERIFISLFIGPVVSVIGMAMYWFYRKPTLEG